MTRLFVALTFPSPVCDQIERHAKRELTRVDRLAHFTDTMNLHLTLAFIGEADEAAGRRLNAALAPLGMLTPNRIETGYLEHWHKANALVLGITPRESLDELAKAVRAEITRQGLTFDKRAFVPHITLARHWRRPITDPRFPTFALELTRPVVMVSERDPRTKALRYRQLM